MELPKTEHLDLVSSLGKIFGIKWQPVVKLYNYMATNYYFDSNRTKIKISNRSALGHPMFLAVSIIDPTEMSDCESSTGSY